MTPASALAILLVVAPATRPADEVPSDAAAAALARGREAYDRGDFEAAMKHFEAAWEIDGSPVYLYPWAQAARNAGDCELAVDLYDRFLASGVQGDARTAAEQNAERCRDELVARAPEDPPPSPPPPLPVQSPPADEPEAQPDHPPDAAGIALVATGSAAVVAGAIVLAVAEQRVRQQRDAEQYGRFDDLDASIDRMHIAGGVTLGVGAALALGGAIRFGVVSRRRRRARAISIVIGRTPRGGPSIGLVITAPRPQTRLSPFSASDNAAPDASGCVARRSTDARSAFGLAPCQRRR
jgi:hypothetical protein